MRTRIYIFGIYYLPNHVITICHSSYLCFAISNNIERSLSSSEIGQCWLAASVISSPSSLCSHAHCGVCICAHSLLGLLTLWLVWGGGGGSSTSIVQGIWFVPFDSTFLRHRIVRLAYCPGMYAFHVLESNSHHKFLGSGHSSPSLCQHVWRQWNVSFSLSLSVCMYCLDLCQLPRSSFWMSAQTFFPTQNRADTTTCCGAVLICLC